MNRRNGLAHPPRSSVAGCPDRLRRPGRHAKTGLNSVNDILQRLPSSGGGLNSKFNNSGNLGNRPTVAVSVPARQNRSSLPELQARARARRWHPLRQRRVRQRRARGRPTSTPFLKARSSGSRCCRIALPQSTVPTPSRGRQHHHQAPPGRFMASAQIGEYLDEADGRPRTIN